jgi:hypothetical protein
VALPVQLDESANRSLARVHQHTQDRNIGIISAHRGENTAEENAHLHKQLGADIRKAGYGHIKVKGRYIENHGTKDARPVDEKSYLVVGHKGDDKGALKGFLKKHGEKYNQDSVLHKPHNTQKATLHGTSHRENAWPAHGETHDVGDFHANRAGEFHSVMKGKRTFAFEDYSFWNEPTFSNRKETLF